MLQAGEAEPSRKTAPQLTPLDEPTQTRIAQLESLRPRTFSWLAMRTLLESRNWALAELIRGAHTDIVNDERDRWIAAVRDAGVLQTFCDFVVKDMPSGDVSFLVVGDPGEADKSQYVTVPAIERHGTGTDFMVVLSDVIYPTGETNDYVAAFYEPYREYRRPIYALPGNHDWYALLTGFMWHFCDMEPLPETPVRLSSYTWQERLARFLWLRPKAPNRPLLKSYRDERAIRITQALEGDPDEALPFTRSQPGPYFAIDTAHVRIVCIDTGTSGTIDRDQGSWLCRVSERSGEDQRPRILLTGKPIYVNSKYKPTEIVWRSHREPPLEGRLRQHLASYRAFAPEPEESDPEQPFDFCTVDDVVRDRAHGYIAAIGGDVHNYQRYPVRFGKEEREIQYIVAGGGGAFMSPTHLIEKIDSTELGDEPPGETTESPSGTVPAPRHPLSEDDLRLFPLRGDSLARYTQGSTSQLRTIVLVSLTVSAILIVLAGWLSQGRTMSWPVGVVLAVDAAGLLVFLGWHRSESIKWRLRHLWLGWFGLATSFLAAVLIAGVLSVVIYGSFQVGRVQSEMPPELGEWATVVIAGIVVALAAGVLFLPWFRLRLRLVWAAFSAGIGVYLLGWAGGAELLVVSLAVWIILLLASRKTVRGLRLTPRLVLAGAAGVAVTKGLTLGWPTALIAGMTLAVPGALIIGGPRYSWRSLLGIGVALLVAAQALWAIANGLAWLLLAALALLAAAPAVYTMYVAWTLLVHDRPVDRDVAARYVAERLGTNPERGAAQAESVGRWANRKLNALLPTNPTRRILYGGETVYSAIFDFNDAPFYKSFLRLEVSDKDLTISCFGVTDANKVRLEDEVRWRGDRWTKARARLVDPGTKQSFGSADLYWQSAGATQIALDLGVRVDPGTPIDVELAAKAAGTHIKVSFPYERDALNVVTGAAAGTRFRKVVVSAGASAIARGDFL